VQFFMWLLCHKRIQCHTNLLKKWIVSNALCEICSEADETPEHIILAVPLHGIFGLQLASRCRLDRASWTYTEFPAPKVSLNKILRHWWRLLAGSCGRDGMRWYSEKKGPHSISYWDHARVRRNNGELECQGSEDRW
jgi:hypothetical protein